MKNEMTLDKTGLTIPGSELAECGMAGVDLSAQMTHSLLLLMPREMTVVQVADALAGLFDAASAACVCPAGRLSYALLQGLRFGREGI